MSFSEFDLQGLARLARLKVDGEEIAAYTDSLARILDMVARMQAVDTTGVEPLAHPLDMTARLRPDEVTEPDVRDRVQALAPAVAAGHYLVPKVIE